MNPKYVQIKLYGGNAYILPFKEIPNAVQGELDDLQEKGQITITFRAVNISDEGYEQLDEFTGH
jgi:hypothetical protein